MEADPIRAGLLGWPLRSSLSPGLHQSFFRQTGIAGSYSLLRVEPARLEDALGDLHDRGYQGLNVTVPHKTRAYSACVELDGSARAAGAVNTLRWIAAGWMGYDTDGEGFGEATRIHGLRPSFAVVGCGGAGRAASAWLSGLLLGHAVFCRSMSLPGSRPLEALSDYASSPECSTVVNATPLGWGDGDPFPLDPGSLEGKVFFDLNYNPGWAWRNSLGSAGVRVVTGETMLACQAAASFRIWTGVMPDAGRALEEAVATQGRSPE